MAEPDPALRQVRRLTRRGFVVGGAASLAGLGAWAWLGYGPQDEGISWPLRRVMEANEALASASFRHSHAAPEFGPSLAGEPRVNGRHGLGTKLDAARWKLKVESIGLETRTLTLDLDAIKKLPRVESVSELKCIEGWSQVVHWTGARLSDFMEVNRLGTRDDSMPDPNGHRGKLLKYVGLTTPDSVYFVGLDMPSALHPQTLLCYEMNGEPLTEGHGAPLRLVIPVKYGIKSIKRVGTIRFSDERPADYWAKKGYDWYAGL